MIPHRLFYLLLRCLPGLEAARQLSHTWAALLAAADQKHPSVRRAFVRLSEAAHPEIAIAPSPETDDG